MPFHLIRAFLFAVLAASAAHAQSPALRVVSSEALRGRDSFEALGLTGANKPNGLAYRLRLDVPADLPAYVPRTVNGHGLQLAQSTPEGWLGLYVTAPDGPANGNPIYHAALFGADGERRWGLDLNRFLSRRTHLEIQDIRLRAGKLYFNEACQSYSAEARGRCSALVRVDPVRGTLDWRSRNLVSNNVFIFSGPYLVAGYGFTREPDFLFLVSPETGRVLATRPLDSAHSYLEERDGIIHAVTTHQRYRLRIGR
jgi:hypothetical protein